MGPCCFLQTLSRPCKGSLAVQEALYQCASDGTPFEECLQQQGVLPGVKVDEAWAHTYLMSLACQSQALCCCVMQPALLPRS